MHFINTWENYAEHQHKALFWKKNKQIRYRIATYRQTICYRNFVFLNITSTLAILQQFTCVADISQMQGVQYFDVADVRRLYLITAIEGTCVVIVTFVLVYLTSRSFRYTNVSQKTIELQKRYQISLILQVPSLFSFLLF